MRSTLPKPEKLGNVNAAMPARIQFIDDSVDPPKWRTVAECIDTPNAIRNALSAIEKSSRPLWIKTAFERRLLA